MICRYHAQLRTEGDSSQGEARMRGEDQQERWKRKSRSRAAWRTSAHYYRLASRVLPSSGNPFNQLAVMAFYTGDELRAVYYYFRSLRVLHPFMTARENLAMLFQKNRPKAEAVQKVAAMLCMPATVLR
jgi:Est1 DNA/RNA binding domain